MGNVRTLALWIFSFSCLLGELAVTSGNYADGDLDLVNELDRPSEFGCSQSDFIYGQLADLKTDWIVYPQFIGIFKTHTNVSSPRH
jgi:hypothetical protein